MVVWLRGLRLPDPELEADENGLVALGGKLDPDCCARLRRGIFPWSSDPVVTWWSPDPRAIFDLERWKPHRSVRQAIRQSGWRFTVDRDSSG